MCEMFPPNRLLIVAFVTVLVSASSPVGAEPESINSTVCSARPCSFQSSDLSFSCLHSGCREIPVGDIPNDARHVDLRGNRVQTVQATLAGLKFVEGLDLSANEIVAIESKAFPASLVFLNLSNNSVGLDLLDSDAFSQLDNLESLNLSNNRIDNLTRANIFYMRFPKLMALDLSGNSIEVIAHNAMTDLKNLQSLRLSRNRIRDIESFDFLGLSKVDFLDLSQNRLEEIPELMFHGLESIRTVDFSQNFIEVINDNSFATRGGRLDRPTPLENLYLANNLLRRIPSVLSQQLTSLRFISVDDNPLESIDEGSFGEALTSVSIQRCHSLQELKDVFSKQGQLTKVTISSNDYLGSISDTMFGGQQSAVRDLDLSYNALVSLPSNLVDWANLTSTNFSGNFWNCDCTMAWIKQLPRAKFQTLVCYNPLHLRGRRIGDVDEAQLSCNVINRFRRQGAIALAVCFTVIFLAAVVFVMQNYRQRIFPSWSSSSGKYETLFSSSDAAADDELSKPVTIKRYDEPEAVAV